MSAPRRVVLHIGTHKTGTSSVQASLDRARQQLAATGVRFFRDPVFNPKNHYIFHHAFTPILEWHFHTPWLVRRKGISQAEMREILRTEVTSFGADDDLIVSAEDLAILPQQGVQAMRDFFLDVGVQDVTVVCVLRNPVDYLHSSIQQYMKVGLTSIEDVLNNDFSSYALQSCPNFAGGAVNILRQIYIPVIARYVSVFGPEKCRFLRFDEAVANGLSRSVLEAGLGPDAPTIPERRSNDGISREAAVLLATYNSLAGRYADREKLAPYNMRLSKALQKVRGTGARFPISMSPNEIEAVNGDIATANRIVGRAVVDPIHPDAFRESIELTRFSRDSLDSLMTILDELIPDSDTSLALRYRDAAIRVGESDPEAAYLLMRRASELKPDGNVIKARLHEFQSAAARIQ